MLKHAAITGEERRLLLQNFLFLSVQLPGVLRPSVLLGVCRLRGLAGLIGELRVLTLYGSLGEAGVAGVCCNWN